MFSQDRPVKPIIIKKQHCNDTVTNHTLYGFSKAWDATTDRAVLQDDDESIVPRTIYTVKAAYAIVMEQLNKETIDPDALRAAANVLGDCIVNLECHQTN